MCLQSAERIHAGHFDVPPEDHEDIMMCHGESQGQHDVSREILRIS